MILKNLIIILIFSFLILVLGGCNENPSKKKKERFAPDVTSKKIKKKKILKLGRIPFISAEKMMTDHVNLLKYLEKELGVDEVRLVLAPNYDNIIEQLKNGKIDIAWLGTFTIIKAEKDAGAEVLLKIVRYGKDFYKGVFIVRNDKNINKIEDLKGKTMAFVDKDSSSGYIFPKALLIEKGIDPERHFSKVTFLKKHDAVVRAVFLGKVDAGAVYRNAEKTLKDPEKIKQLKTLVETEKISNEPIVVRKGLDKDLKEKILKAFLNLNNTEQHKEVFKGCLNDLKFQKAVSEDYNYIRKVDKLLKDYESKKESK